jgi:hypothetical protein
VLETGVAALPTVAKLIRGFDGIVQKSRILPHAVGLEWQGFFQRAGLCEKKHGAGSPRRVYRSKFEVSAALLQMCLCTACQVGPDHEVMKRPDRVEIGVAQGIVGMHNGCRDEQHAYWRMASKQR